MKPKTLLVFASLMPTIAFTSVARGQDAAERFQRLDKNGDGQIAWAEVYDVRVAEFVKMDADRDGRVVEAEFGGRARPFSAFDIDASGEVALSEYLQSHRSMFSKFDEDGDGTLAYEEFETAQKAVRGG